MNKHYRKYSHDRKNGFGMNLYRNTKKKKIGGVCSGLADHFDIDKNIMRILFVAAFIFTNFLVVWAYVIAWVVLSPKRSYIEDNENDYEYDEWQRCRKRKNMFRYKESPSERIKKAKSRFL